MKKRLFLFVGIVLSLSLGSCKATKVKTTLKSLAVKKIIKEHQKQAFDKETLQAKIRMHYDDGKNAQNVSIKLRMQKDEIIWMSGSFLGFPVAKIKITPTRVQYYEKIKHTYFDGDFSLINEALGSNLDFYQLQNLLTGQAVFNVKNTKFTREIDQQSYLLKPKDPIMNLLVFYWINPQIFKLNKQRIQNIEGTQNLTLVYPDYHKIQGVYFPKEMNILATTGAQSTRIDMDIRSVEVNKKLSFPFRIPENYKEIKINGL